MNRLEQIMLTLLCLCFLGPITAAAEEKKDALLSVFEEVSFPGRAEGFLEFPIYSFYLGAPNIQGEAYVPNFSPRFGLTLGWKEISLSSSLALPLPRSEVDRRGQTEQSNIIISRYWRNLGFNLYYQFYRGFYIASPWAELDRNRPARYPQLPEAEAINWGIHFFISLRPDQLSLSAAMGQGEIQKASGGSYFLMPFYNHLQLARGANFIQGTDPNATQVIPEVRDTHLDTIGATGGYGYIYTQDGFFASGLGGLGPGIQFQQISDSGGNKNGIMNIAGNFNLGISAGKNIQEASFGMRVLASCLASSVATLPVFSTFFDAKIFYSRRF